MKLPECRIEAAAPTAETLWTMNGVLYDVQKKRLVATDGYLLAVVPHEPEEGDAGGIIPTEAFRDARKLAKKAKKRKSKMAILQEPDSIMFSVEGLQSSTFDLAKCAKLPEFDKLLETPVPPFTIAINAHQLFRLALAIQEDSMIVHLHIAGPDKVIVVKPSAAKDSIGLLMPVRATGANVG